LEKDDLGFELMKIQHKKLRKEYGGKLVPFKDLTKPYQLAIIHYMAIDGEAWGLFGNMDCYCNSTPSKIKRELEKNLPEYIKRHGRRKFGVMNLPIDICKKLIMKVEAIAGESLEKEHGSFDEYHAWYTTYDMPNHTNRNPYPCILSSFNDELFQDGWHRFHRYVELKMKMIPCVYYP
jgi:hypothetical protein